VAAAAAENWGSYEDFIFAAMFWNAPRRRSWFMWLAASKAT
jgi:hypothetical protein